MYKLLLLVIFNPVFFSSLLIISISPVWSQSASDTVIFTELGKHQFNFTYSGYTPLFDRMGRPYVYLAAKELGLVTFDISNTSAPVPVDTQIVSSLGNLKVTGLAQQNNFLFLSLGDFQGSTQNAGIAVFDISDPVSPVLLDRWDSAAFKKGTATVLIFEDFAYLGAMATGVLILDISDKQEIKFISQIIPDTSFGDNSYEYHSRGLFLGGDTLLVANDNGGLRMIDVSDKQNPVETAMYISDSVSSAAYPFYNHVYRLGNYAFCAIDYCGIEVIDVSVPASFSPASWLNPWNCSKLPPPFGSWNGSNGHTNEIAFSSSQNLLFFSGGDTEILAVDPSDPSSIKILGTWGLPDDSVGTWGIDVYGNLAALANVRSFGFPFVSTVGGLQLLNWNFTTGKNELSKPLKISGIFPNPLNNSATVIFDQPVQENVIVTIQDQLGRGLIVNPLKLPSGAESFRLDCKNLECGIYTLVISGKNFCDTKKIVKMNFR